MPEQRKPILYGFTRPSAFFETTFAEAEKRWVKRPWLMLLVLRFHRFRLKRKKPVCKGQERRPTTINKRNVSRVYDLQLNFLSALMQQNDGGFTGSVGCIKSRKPMQLSWFGIERFASKTNDLFWALGLGLWHFLHAAAAVSDFMLLTCLFGHGEPNRKNNSNPSRSFDGQHAILPL
jgi:hypothetical protein